MNGGEWFYIDMPFNFPCKVINTLNSAYGKFPDSDEDLEDVEEIYTF